MSSILIGFIAIIIGILFCFRGVVAMRVVIAVWGAFVGLNLGAGLVSAVTGDGFFSTAVGWIVGIAVAILFALLAYLYYAVAVTLAMASIGFVLGTALMAAIGVTWNWVIIVVGVLVGILLAVAAIALNLPALLLVVLSALGGATAIVGGLMLLTSTIALDDFSRASVTSTIGHHWWWYAAYIVLVIAGVVAQARVIGRDQDLHQQW
ncbi:DUF4203 domain-containing protein [Gordonia sp. PS3]|uniref:TM7S3/TM198-like domain-containing protein n=1 Tax=Gordonia sihwensis NBRC 108236 TaxID=1223544 RepID=L7LQI5_9ACTN|nr:MULTISPECIES: DUF4203 domain-containing protein [Gordonia]AUH68590.1 DUF4203 domain-containing protein [Gordonia sp. YC-JH1]MBY4571121.1 DUF4203 domain-containing protein [Gordonia sihwensis]WFN91669.1 DUF4203 domain-containing protein [Gordonia sihwensis]GAC62442.1 hypothetical protein GSI01S_34_00540 [Gordonia sihwensis NBRC 108236]